MRRTSVAAPVGELKTDDKQFTDDSESVVTISKAVDEVRLNFTVTDKNGKFIKALRAEDFNLLDNLHPPERVNHFQANSESPLRVVMLFDISSSIRYRFDFEQKAANHFLKHVLRPGVDQAAIISFGSEVTEVQSMTGDVNKLTSAISHLQPGGDTALHDAVVRASRDLRSQFSPSDARKIVIILSDGADTTSHAKAKDCNAAAISSEATILVVDASVPSERNSPGQIFLRKIALNSGGFVLPAREDSEIKDAFKKIDGVLRNQYALSYKPADFERDGAFRSVQLSTRKRGLIAHSRNGYYAK
ncbi:MAG: VWA domain-containing protein [Terriglobales bacterium]